MRRGSPRWRLAVADKHPDYWKVKAAILNARLVYTNAQAAVNEANAQQAAAWAAAGLDASKEYVLSDADETITEKT